MTNVPVEIGNLTNLNYLNLLSNNLTSIPAEIGNLTNLNYLNLNGNKLSSLPSDITSLTKLETVYINYNALDPSDSEIIQFLDSKQSGWRQTQTIPPQQLTVAAITNNAMSLTWSPIAYTGHQGGYEIYYRQGSNEFYTIYNVTADKSIAQITISELLSNTTYYFKARSVTYPHSSGKWYENNHNTVYSSFTGEISAKTLPSMILYCDDPVQEVGKTGNIITLQLEDAYGSVPYSMDIWINSTANENGNFYFKGNDGWGWHNEFFVYSLKADESYFKFWFKSSISGNFILTAKGIDLDIADSLDITVLDSPEVAFQAVNSEISESTPWPEIQVKLNQSIEQDVWVAYSFETATENNASQQLDYVFPAEQQIIIPAGMLSATISLTIINDDIYELNEMIIIRLDSTNISIGSRNTHTLRIIDDDPRPSPPKITGPMSPINWKSPEWCWISGGGSQKYRYKIDDNNLTAGAIETYSS
ncbi:lipoprotein [Candidatus Magnetomorum sp. HK-1]|nr:lipoprotein [Candidatus Magnetomorum sp. HK-1]